MRRTDQLGRRLFGRLAAAVGLVALLGAAAVVPVEAQRPDVPPPREYGESGVSSGVVRIRAGSEWLPVGSAGGEARSRNGSPCTTSDISVLIADDFAQPAKWGWSSFGADGTVPFAAEPGDLPADLAASSRLFSPTGVWYAVMCDGDIRRVPEGGPAVTALDLAIEAHNLVDPAEPDLSIVPAELHFTQLESWLAVEPAYWVGDPSERTRRASAGRVWVDATAEAAEAIWDPGDGTGPLICEGPGTVWQPGLDDGANTCPHTYRRSSAGAPGAAFSLSATVVFAVTATTNAPVALPPLPDIERTTTLEVQVGEIQAVND